MKKTFFIISLIVFSTSILFFFVYLSFYDGKLHLVVCDVGQGDAIYARTPSGVDILIDGGPNKSVLSCLSNYMPFWDKTIEVVILTHPDADHITGVVAVTERYNVNALFTQPNPGSTDIYRLFEQRLAEKKLSVKFVEAGDVLKMPGGVEFDILSPQSNQPDLKTKSGSLNVYSVISKLRYGQFSVLLTGDAGYDVLNRIAKRVGDIDILKVPHHGSKTGMSDDFLGFTKPEIALISVGAKNRYGHPAKLSLDLLDKYRVKTFRTDQNGEIEILSDGLTYSLKLQKN